ncbi:4-phosphoerythronate dehydrogenase [Alginatibacterium sediminis]|uniref:Erythronate-4-phosphate dehydrogenase n=1 Tax=Alginatibacterium sediminis TaxID=2164068 RepID=A0A420EFY5_9ALTE|nr:4-phosphoerythronate dehydrogenase [Alginatibacterium sediminis]RKF19597.1 4-phosphoerythronate dehydrogenase [Alginatibacterium sediminis]
MKIIADENMPALDACFSSFGSIERVAGRTLSPEQLVDADVLLVRSITQVNQALLSKANTLKFVGTATIGTEHIDQNYLASKDIHFHSAPGCNAIAVGEYVVTALLALATEQRRLLSQMSIAIVGGGNTGMQAARCCSALGMQVVVFDPPKHNAGFDSAPYPSADFNQVLACDVISLHVPLTRSGDDPTYHLFDKMALQQLRSEQILINACRGEVIDNYALLELAQQSLHPNLILDVWEGEPEVLWPLVEYAQIASPHIAGYSFEGKLRGSLMLAEQLCKSLSLEANALPDIAQLAGPASISKICLNLDAQDELSAQDTLARSCQSIYDIYLDDRYFRKQAQTVSGFDLLRKQYRQRREFSSCRIDLPPIAAQDHSFDLARLGFQLGN